MILLDHVLRKWLNPMIEGRETNYSGEDKRADLHFRIACDVVTKIRQTAGIDAGAKRRLIPLHRKLRKIHRIGPENGFVSWIRPPSRASQK